MHALGRPQARTLPQPHYQMQMLVQYSRPTRHHMYTVQSHFDLKHRIALRDPPLVS